MAPLFSFRALIGRIVSRRASVQPPAPAAALASPPPARPLIRLVERYCDVLPSGDPGPLTRALDLDGVVEHWQLLERIAHLERSDPAAAAWCDVQLRIGAHAEAETVVAAAEALSQPPS